MCEGGKKKTREAFLESPCPSFIHPLTQSLSEQTGWKGGRKVGRSASAGSTLSPFENSSVFFLFGLLSTLSLHFPAVRTGLLKTRSKVFDSGKQQSGISMLKGNAELCENADTGLSCNLGQIITRSKLEPKHIHNKHIGLLFSPL